MDILPVEIWWKILKFLPGPDLCSVALVCSFFRHITQEPALWSFVTINKDKIEQYGLDQIFSKYSIVCNFLPDVTLCLLRRTCLQTIDVN